MEYRCFDVSYSCDEPPAYEALLSTFSPWLSRRGDPAMVAEVFHIGDHYEVSATMWSSNLTTVAVVARTLPEGAEIDPVPHIDYREQLSRRLCRDKSRRVLAARAGF